MKKHLLVLLLVAIAPFSAFAVDGVVLINQSTVIAAGGFPYVINQPGSYKLSGNLVVPSGLNGIDIAASNVTLDLNGFNISSLGFTAFGSTTRAISAIGTNAYNVVIRNGTLTNWLEGILFSSDARLITVQDLSFLGDFTIEGTMVRNALAVSVPAHSLVKRVVTDGQVQVTCPSIVSETVANIFQFGGGCVLSTTTAP